MSTSTLSHGKTGNQLLDALSQPDFERLLPHIESTPMAFKQIFHKQGQTIAHAYFPTGGVGSVTKVMSESIDGIELSRRITDRRSMAGPAPTDSHFTRTLDAVPVHWSVWLCPPGFALKAD